MIYLKPEDFRVGLFVLHVGQAERVIKNLGEVLCETKMYGEITWKVYWHGYGEVTYPQPQNLILYNP